MSDAPVKGRARPLLTLGDMRTFGFNALQVCCPSCDATRIVDVSILPDQVPLDWFAPRMRCDVCGENGPTVHPHRVLH